MLKAEKKAVCIEGITRQVTFLFSSFGFSGPEVNIIYVCLFISRGLFLSRKFLFSVMYISVSFQFCTNGTRLHIPIYS